MEESNMGMFSVHMCCGETDHDATQKADKSEGKSATTTGKGKNRHIGSLISIDERDRDGIGMNRGGFHGSL